MTLFLHCTILKSEVELAEDKFGDLWTHDIVYPKSTTDGVRSITVYGKQYMPRMTYFEPGRPLRVYYDENCERILLTKEANG